MFKNRFKEKKICLAHAYCHVTFPGQTREERISGKGEEHVQNYAKNLHIWRIEKAFRKAETLDSRGNEWLKAIRGLSLIHEGFVK